MHRKPTLTLRKLFQVFEFVLHTQLNIVVIYSRLGLPVASAPVVGILLARIPPTSSSSVHSAASQMSARHHPKLCSYWNLQEIKDFNSDRSSSLSALS